MLLSLNWLREFIPYEGDAARLGELLTMAGLELEGLERPFACLRPIVVGLVAECGKHPEADKLSVCKVDVGDEVLDIVCGAPNVAKGQKVAVVRAGVTLPGGLTVKKTKLRGLPSHGMICSEFELGLSEDHDGIMVLDPAAIVGESLLDALNLDDEVLDISVTPNRGDCLSVLGFAREVSAITGLPLSLPCFSRRTEGEDASKVLAIDIVQPEISPLYQGLVIEDAVTRPSPGWLRYRLRSIGMRPISNLVDATNYVLIELGQPLHAFDLDTIRGGRVIVRGADAGERFTTLDGQERVLVSADITIRDAEGVIALGGVMGGRDSEITGASRRVFLESAVFNPVHIRKTSRRLNLHSEAAFRFERGVDQIGSTFAVERAAHLMAELSGGFVRPGIMKAEPKPFCAPSLILHKKRAEAVLGVYLQSGFCADTLDGLGCDVADLPGDEATFAVKPPSWRHDLCREADLIEEIARIYGVDRIPAILPKIPHVLESAGAPESMYAFQSRLKHWGRGIGLSEIITYSFVSHKELDFMGVAREGRVSIMNPLSDDLDVLRTHMAPGLLNALRNNLAQSAASVRLMEFAAAFSADKQSETTVHEAPRLGIVLCGSRSDRLWPRPEGELDYADLKGLVEHLLASLSLPEAVFTLASDPLPWLFPCVEVTINGVAVGFCGRVRPETAAQYHAKKPVWLAEMDLEALRLLCLERTATFAPLPAFPSVRRDVTFVAPATVTAGAVLTAARAGRSPLLEDAAMLDLFEPDGTAERNITVRLTFRHDRRTLKDAEADKQRAIVAGAVEAVLPVKAQDNV